MRPLLASLQCVYFCCVLGTPKQRSRWGWRNGIIFLLHTTALLHQHILTYTHIFALQAVRDGCRWSILLFLQLRYCPDCFIADISEWKGACRAHNGKNNKDISQTKSSISISSTPAVGCLCWSLLELYYIIIWFFFVFFFVFCSGERKESKMVTSQGFEWWMRGKQVKIYLTFGQSSKMFRLPTDLYSLRK